MKKTSILENRIWKNLCWNTGFWIKRVLENDFEKTGFGETSFGIHRFWKNMILEQQRLLDKLGFGKPALGTNPFWRKRIW